MFIAASPQESPLFQDSFDSSLLSKWTWVRQDKTEWRLVDGQLEVKSQPGRMWSGNDAKNILLAPELKTDKAAACVSVTHKGDSAKSQVSRRTVLRRSRFARSLL